MNTPVSLRERLAQLGAAPDAPPVSAAPLAKLSGAAVLHGAAACAGAPYPGWLIERLIQQYSAPRDYPYVGFVSHAEKLIQSDHREEGYELLYQLTIEPFQMMAEAEEKEDP